MNEKLEKQEKELMIDILFNYASIGDLKNVKKLIEEKKIDINSTKYGLTALSVCSAKSGNIEVIKYLLNSGAEIRDSQLYAIKAGNTESAEALLSHLSKINPNLEKSPSKDSAVFAPYMTPLMLAAICGHRSLIELLLFRGHTIPFPHLSYCECDDCTVSSTKMSTQSQRNLDIYKALCNPQYIGLNSSDPITKAFELENETRLAIEKSNYYSHHYKDLFTKIENYVTDLIDVTRDAEEVKVLLKQSGAKTRPNAYIKYPALQNAIDQNWKNFIASKQIESLRSHLWLGENKAWFRSGIDGFGRKLFYSLGMILGQLFFSIAFIIHYRKHITAQNRYLCHLFNQSIFSFVLLSFLTQNPSQNSFPLILIVKTFLILWTIGTIVNIARKFAIFGPRKLCRFYGNVFELIITFEMMVTIITIFSYDTRKFRKTDESIDKSTSIHPNQYCSDSGYLTCFGLNYILLVLLLKLTYLRLIFISSIRAYKGTHEHGVIHLFLLSFCIISVFYPLFSNTFGYISHLRDLQTYGANIFGNTDHMFIFITTNFMIGFIFEISKGPEKISDKFWCYHWTARLIYEIHGSCELSVPFNILEIHRVFFIFMRRAGLREHINQTDVQKYNQIKSLVYARYECIKYLKTKSCCECNFNSISKSI